MRIGVLISWHVVSSQFSKLSMSVCVHTVVITTVVFGGSNIHVCVLTVEVMVFGDPALHLLAYMCTYTMYMYMS